MSESLASKFKSYTIEQLAYYPIAKKRTTPALQSQSKNTCFLHRPATVYTVHGVTIKFLFIFMEIV